MRLAKCYGWTPDIPDHRDYSWFPPSPPANVLPPCVDLRDDFPVPPGAQGNLGSCTAWMVGSMIQFAQAKQGIEVMDPSRLYVYYNARLLRGSQDWDSGAGIRDVVKAVNTDGACHETEWPYVIERFREKPDAGAYLSGGQHQALEYSRVERDSLRKTLAAGKPIGIGISVYESFESAEVEATGVVPMPRSRERLVGGHAVVVCGYDDEDQRYFLRNSWGPTWGRLGYFCLPYKYLEDPDLSEDFWVINLMES